jgi:hypothetical protein
MGLYTNNYEVCSICGRKLNIEDKCATDICNDCKCVK